MAATAGSNGTSSSRAATGRGGLPQLRDVSTSPQQYAVLAKQQYQLQQAAQGNRSRQSAENSHLRRSESGAAIGQPILGSGAVVGRSAFRTPDKRVPDKVGQKLVDQPPAPLGQYGGSLPKGRHGMNMAQSPPYSPILRQEQLNPHEHQRQQPVARTAPNSNGSLSAAHPRPAGTAAPCAGGRQQVPHTGFVGGQSRQRHSHLSTFSVKPCKLEIEQATKLTSAHDPSSLAQKPFRTAEQAEASLGVVASKDRQAWAASAYEAFDSQHESVGLNGVDARSYLMQIAQPAPHRGQAFRGSPRKKVPPSVVPIQAIPMEISSNALVAKSVQIQKTKSRHQTRRKKTVWSPKCARAATELRQSEETSARVLLASAEAVRPPKDQQQSRQEATYTIQGKVFETSCSPSQTSAASTAQQALRYPPTEVRDRAFEGLCRPQMLLTPNQGLKKPAGFPSGHTAPRKEDADHHFPLSSMPRTTPEQAEMMLQRRLQGISRTPVPSTSPHLSNSCAKK